MRALLLLVLVQAAFGAGRKATGADVVECVFTSLYSDGDEMRLAEELDSLQMTEQLSRRVATYFQSLGLRPMAVSSLHRLAEKSAALPLPAQSPLAIQPLPSAEGQREILENLFQYARTYVHALPNFLCEQLTKRYSNLDGFGSDWNPRYRAKLRHGDTAAVNLSFAAGSEQQQLTQAPKKTLSVMNSKRGQSSSMGEFGGDMAMIFAVDASPDVSWDHWEYFRGRRRAVFSYSVGLPKSRFTLFYCCSYELGSGEIQQTYRSAIRGLVYVDPESGSIARLIIKAVDLPSNFHVKESNTIIDYGEVKIGGRAYTLPVEALVSVRSDGQKNRNEISFRKYRKFNPESVMTSVDSTISYRHE